MTEELVEEVYEDSFGNEAEIDEETLDKIADSAIETLQTLLKYFNSDDITIDEYEGDEGELIFDINGDDLALLIGRHGKTLNSLQFLVSSMVMRKIDYRYPVVVDVNGYKSRQRQKIEAFARSAAQRAIKQKHDVKMRPMTPYERRIVHILLRNDNRVETFSEGEGINRHIVIRPL